MDWRDSLDPVLKEHFNDLLKDVHKEKQAYADARNPTKAQLWCALAVLSKEVSDLRLQIKSLEKQIKPKYNMKLKKELEKL